MCCGVLWVPACVSGVFGVFGVISAVGLPEWDLLLSDHFNRRGQQLRDGSRRGTAGLMHDAAAASGPYAVLGVFGVF